MSMTRRAATRLPIFIVAAVLVVLVVYERYIAPHSEIESSMLASGVPVVMRSPGGLLEVSTVTVYERFRRTDAKQFWGMPLGTTVSIIQVPVTYRYHIEMAKEWPIYLSGKTALVHAGEVRPSLPAAIDTSKMEKYTQSGWARFNKDENLELLERSITPQLEARSQAPAIRQLAIDAGRQTVREFVTTWLLKEQGWQRDGDNKVIVLFPGEQPPRAGANPS